MNIFESFRILVHKLLFGFLNKIVLNRVSGVLDRGGYRVVLSVMLGSLSEVEREFGAGCIGVFDLGEFLSEVLLAGTDERLSLVFGEWVQVDV
jgi:hypothetical protein